MNAFALPELTRVAFTYPAIDNHAHPFLKAQYRDHFDFEGLISEAAGGALTEDAITTLACFRATLQLSKLYKLPGEPTWDAVKQFRRAMDYDQLCGVCMAPTKIQCILIDDGLGGVSQFAEDYKWHDRFTGSPTKRIVRVETLAEDILKRVFDAHLATGSISPGSISNEFSNALNAALEASARDPEVVGYKSIACYRTGLDITVNPDAREIHQQLTLVMLRYETTKELRLAYKPLNDFVVNTVLRISEQCGKPVQFHTGLGDNDITLNLSSPSLMQPIIKAYPKAKIVLLHSSYPYTRDAGYLTAVYPNVFLDFGEVFPFLSAEGQVGVIRQMLELCPTNKIMWSTDGHWWPESYYLGTLQAREALLKVLSETVLRQEMTENQAIKVLQDALFHNANRIYSLGLEPKW